MKLNKQLKLGLLFCLSLGAAPLQANTAANGTWLLGLCSGLINSTASTPGNNYCAGFIQGVMLSWYTAQTQVNPQGAAFWIDQFGMVPAISSAQAVVKYLTQNPQILNQSAVSIIISVINQNYPIPPATGS
jgi:hypothetical protein